MVTLLPRAALRGCAALLCPGLACFGPCRGGGCLYDSQFFEKLRESFVSIDKTYRSLPKLTCYIALFHLSRFFCGFDVTALYL